MAALEFFVNLFTVYVALGMVFAVAFVVRGITRVDHAAKGSGVAFRLAVLPGAAALWPLLLRRWIRAERSGS